MKVKPSSPALSNQGDVPNPEGMSKEANALVLASGYPKIISIKEVGRGTAKLPKILKIHKEVAELTTSIHATAEDIGDVIEALEENRFEVKGDIGVFKIYKIL